MTNYEARIRREIFGDDLGIEAGKISLLVRYAFLKKRFGRDRRYHFHGKHADSAKAFLLREIQSVYSVFAVPSWSCNIDRGRAGCLHEAACVSYQWAQEFAGQHQDLPVRNLCYHGRQYWRREKYFLAKGDRVCKELGLWAHDDALEVYAEKNKEVLTKFAQSIGRYAWPHRKPGCTFVSRYQIGDKADIEACYHDQRGHRSFTVTTTFDYKTLHNELTMVTMYGRVLLSSHWIGSMTWRIRYTEQGLGYNVNAKDGWMYHDIIIPDCPEHLLARRKKTADVQRLIERLEKAAGKEVVCELPF